jgi:YD repeat-containing protein
LRCSVLCPSQIVRASSSGLALCLVLLLSSGALAQSNPFNSEGFPTTHGTYGSFPYEQVDPLSGNLLVAVTDLSLPGPIPLAVSRTYNSKFHRDFEHNDFAVDEWSALGVGWRMHFGRVLRADSSTPGATVIETPDGGGQALYQTSAYIEGWITKRFVRYSRSTNTAKFPNGLTYTFNHVGEPSGPRGQVLYVTSIADQFGNTITFTYGAPGRLTNIHQTLSPSQSRDVAFNYSPDGSLATIVHGARIWTFEHDAAPGLPGQTLLRKVIPPSGLPWDHLYTSLELTALVAPTGGRVDYVYDTVQRRSGPLTQNSRVVKTRTTSGPLIEAGTWTFTYGQGNNFDTTTVACPCGTTSYRYNGIGATGDASSWRTGTLAERQVIANNAPVEIETLSYIRSEAISTSSVTGEGGQWSDLAVYGALLSQRVLTRGTKSWTTTLEYHTGQNNYNDFTRPWRVTEEGELRRITRSTFQYGMFPWIIVGPSAVEVEIGTQTALSSTAYDSATGRATSETRRGVTTQYATNPNGTTSSITNANGHTTTLFYNWGVLSEVRTPHVTVTKVINADGSVARETVGADLNSDKNIVTDFEYDQLGRPTYIRPRNANFIQFRYSQFSGPPFVSVERGAGQAVVHLDGFGRTVDVADQLGVKTRIDRDACGRVRYKSTPYTSGDGQNLGTTVAYDALGRVKTLTVNDVNPALSVTTFNYLGSDVEVTDPGSFVTRYNYQGFSGPNDSRLVSVIDAAGATTAYQYDVFENLKRVDGPGSGVPPRIWTYDSATGRLQTESQPESGTTSYTYDTLGNLKTVTDAAGRQTTFTYDANERLTDRVTASDSTATLGVSYDAAGRVISQSLAGIVTAFSYDSVGRLESRTDTLDSAQAYLSRYNYDGNDNLTQLRYPCIGVNCTGRSVTYAYDLANRLTDVFNNGAAFATNFVYDDAGRLATYQTGLVTHRVDYDIRGRVARLRAGPAAGNAIDLSYAYNNVGQVATVTDSRGAAWNQTFGYDPVRRLTSAGGPWGQIGWGYDATGNRRSENRGASTVYDYSASTNRLTSTTGSTAESFAYTNVGEVSSDGQGTYSYSTTGTMLTATRPGLAAAFQYDATNLRVARTVNGTKIVSVRDAAGQVLSEMQSRCGSSLEWVKDNVYAGPRLLGAVKNGALSRPTFSLAGPEPRDVAESAGSAPVDVTLISGGPLPCAATVSWDTAAGTAVPGIAPSGDYTTKSGTVTFAAGTANGAVVTAAVPVNNDAVNETSETFSVRLTGVTGGVLSAAPGATSRLIRLNDDDPLPSLTVNDATVNETSGTVVVTVSLAGLSDRVVSASYATGNVTATAGSDYTGATGTVTFAPGQTVASIQVTIVDDSAPETAETFNLTLSNPSNASLTRATGSVTINSDELRVPIDPSLPGQYFPDVISDTTEVGYLQIFNPHTVPVTAKLTYTWPTGAGASSTLTVPAQQRVDVDLSGVAGVGGTGSFSAVVQSLDVARPLVSEHSGYSTPATFAAGRNDLGATPAPTWYFGEGASNGFFNETLTVLNPTNGPVTVTVQLVQTAAAPVQVVQNILAGPGRWTFNVNSGYAIGDHGTIVSAVSQGTSTPANIVVQRTLRWPVGGTTVESSTSSGTSTLTNNWYFAEGGKGGWSNFLAFMNPSPTQQAEAFVFYAHDNGQVYGQSVSIPPLRRVTMSPPPGMPDGGFAIHVGSGNLVNYVVERSIYSGAGFALGSASSPSPVQAYMWRFAEGASNSFFDTYFLVFNANASSAANVTMTFRKTNGTVATHTLVVPPRSRAAVMADALPAVDGSNYATEVTTTNGVPIVVERAMFWPQGGWSGSHLSMGRPQ